MVPNKYKPVVEKYPSLNISFLPNPTTIYIHIKYIKKLYKKNCLPNTPYHYLMPGVAVDC